MSVNPGLRFYLDRLVWITRLLGSKAIGDRDVDRRGFCGAVNLEFGPAPDAAWHCLLSDRGIRFGRRRHPSPIGSVALEPDTFLRLLAGHTSYSTCQMTGKVRVEGDGHCGFIVSSIIMQSLARARQRGLRGWLTRWMLRRTLRKSQTGYELKL